MEIDGYRAGIEFDPDIDMFRGEFLDLNGGADFYAKDIDGLRREGAISLKVFLDMCREDGVEPRECRWSELRSRRAAVAERLKLYGAKRGDKDWSVLESRTADLIRNNPFAFLVAVAFDRGMLWYKAWQIPAEIDRKGLLDPELLASMTRGQLVSLFDELPVRPRYGSQQGARTLSDAARLVHGRFGGNAAAIWERASPVDVEKTLQEIYGLGPGIASMTTRILHDDFACFSGQERQIDVKPDVHVLRVFRRAGLTESESDNEAVRAARRLNPEFPGALDWPAWQIGQRWCHAREPQCDACPLTNVCPRQI